MRVLPLALLLPLAACTNPGENGRGIPPTPPHVPATGLGQPGVDEDFDAQAWLAEARSLPDDRAFDSPEAARELRLSDSLDTYLDWRRACDTYPDLETGEPIYEPADEDVLSGARGRFQLAPISESEALVAITCYFGAYQGSYALVRIAGERAALLTAQALDADSQPTRGTQTAFGEVWWEDLARGTFQTFLKGRGLSDCGELVTYALASGDELEIREVRARECGDDIPDPLPPPTEWPVVYTAE